MKRGNFSLILGNMFAGKTEELIKRLRRMEQYEHKNVVVFKPKTDTRSGDGKLKTNKNDTFPAIDIEDSYEVFKKLSAKKFQDGKHINVVAFDEVQFFQETIYNVIQELLARGYDVIAAGLKLDFRGEPFLSSVLLVGLVKRSSDLLILNSCCSVCGEDAELPERIINGKPARYTDPVKLVGGKESYQPKCYEHFEIRGKTPTT